MSISTNVHVCQRVPTAARTASAHSHDSSRTRRCPSSAGDVRAARSGAVAAVAVPGDSLGRPPVPRVARLPTRFLLPGDECRSREVAVARSHCVQRESRRAASHRVHPATEFRSRDGLVPCRYLKVRTSSQEKFYGSVRRTGARGAKRTRPRQSLLQRRGRGVLFRKFWQGRRATGAPPTAKVRSDDVFDVV